MSFTLSFKGLLMYLRQHPKHSRRSLRRYGIYLLLVLIWVAGLALVLDRLYPLDLQRAREHSRLVLDAEDELLRGFTTADGSWRLPVTAAEVDPGYLRMLKAYEDHRFDWHPGVDPLAVVRALGQWITSGKVISGASTLTMQTARLLEPRQRTLTAKLKQLLRALQLEWHYDKAEILSLYLTLAPYGGNLEGVRAASLAYLRKEPRFLTPAEAALLVVLPQAPSRLRPDRFPERARAARDKVLIRMGRLGVLSERQVAEARQDSVPRRRHAMPFHAPHLARRLVAGEPEQTVHRTTIDGALQRTLEALARQELSRLDPQANLAVLVIKNRSRQVMAYLGSADFFASQRAGQVDMIPAIRSPGSTLKPFVYALGFDDLIIHPETLIDDSPTRFGEYTPSNFRNTYAGQVSVREALQRSLNIPAVKVLEQVGPRRVEARLRQGGIRLRWNKTRHQPGLPLVLGGVGTSLADLVTLYLGIASGGEFAPFTLTRPPVVPTQDPVQLLGEVAWWYLIDILADSPPPIAMVSSRNLRGSAPIAYKTGTSYGFRDAWALGFDAVHTVGVWVGRPDGAPSPGRYGRSTAAPLLYRVFDLLPRHDKTLLGAPPAAALTVVNANLPQRLRYFSVARQSSHPGVPPLAITFPVDGSLMTLREVGPGQLQPLPLVARGGLRPLRWLVNGEPVPSSRLRRNTSWMPDGEGAVRVAVIDGLGHFVSAHIWLEQDKPGGSSVDFGLRSAKCPLPRNSASAG